MHLRHCSTTTTTTTVTIQCFRAHWCRVPPCNNDSPAWILCRHSTIDFSVCPYITFVFHIYLSCPHQNNDSSYLSSIVFPDDRVRTSDVVGPVLLRRRFVDSVNIERHRSITRSTYNFCLRSRFIATRVNRLHLLHVKYSNDSPSLPSPIYSGSRYVHCTRILLAIYCYYFFQNTRIHMTTSMSVYYCALYRFNYF